MVSRLDNQFVMTSQQLLWIAIGIALGLTLLFLLPRKKGDPSRLKMKLDAFSRTPVVKTTNSPRPKNQSVSPSGASGVSPETAAEMKFRLDAEAHTSEKNLNVFFNYNGHTWDAFEVLGLPAGASMQKVEAAYIERTQKLATTSRPFFIAAVEAIRQKK
jgi:hypothetical protein